MGNFFEQEVFVFDGQGFRICSGKAALYNSFQQLGGFLARKQPVVSIELHRAQGEENAV